MTTGYAARLVLGCATIAVALTTAACEPTGGSPRDCHDPAALGTPCCDPSVYPAALLTDLVTAPEQYMGKTVEVEGVADWYSDDQSGTECALGHCVVPLGLRSPSCGTTLRLTGVYDGRPVECPETGCYPLIVLTHYAVCGVLQPPEPALDAQPALRLQAFCQR